MSHAKRWGKEALWKGASQDAISLSCGVRTGRHLHVNAILTWAAKNRRTGPIPGGGGCSGKGGSRGW